MVAATAITMSEPLSAVADALEQATATAWNTLSDPEILTGFAAVQGLKNQLDALAGILAVAAEQGSVQRDGSRKSSIWAGANTSGAPAEVRHDIVTTNWLADYGESARRIRPASSVGATSICCEAPNGRSPGGSC